MNQWRTQWEEELTEKNSIDAELLTLRSEFEKSSATYDREIEGLKEILEKERVLREEMNTALNGEEGELAQYSEKLEAQKVELEKLAGAQVADAASVADTEKEIDELKTRLDADKARYEEAVGKTSRAEGELEALKTATSGDAASMGVNIAAIRAELEQAAAEAAKYDGLDTKVEALEAQKAELHSTMESIKSQTAKQSETAVS
jgi:chromosome segregation ATPase